MEVIETALPGVLIIEPNVFGDTRGFFLETFHKQRYQEAGIPAEGLEFMQDNYSRSSKGVLRGLHFQLENPQGKLVSAGTGAVFDVAADVNPDLAIDWPIENPILSAKDMALPKLSEAKRGQLP